jgi:hypothetical protein
MSVYHTSSDLSDEETDEAPPMAGRRVHRPCGALLRNEAGVCWYCHAQLTGDDISPSGSDDPIKPNRPWDTEAEVVRKTPGAGIYQAPRVRGPIWAVGFWVLLLLLLFLFSRMFFHVASWLWENSIG